MNDYEQAADKIRLLSTKSASFSTDFPFSDTHPLPTHHYLALYAADNAPISFLSYALPDFVHNKFLQEKKSSGRFRSLSNGSGGWKKAEEWLKKEEDGHRYPYIAGSWIQKQPEHFQLWKRKAAGGFDHCRMAAAEGKKLRTG